jgi:hypothetical protein
MRTRYRVDSETVRLEANDGSASIVLELSRTGLGRARPDDPGFIRSSRAQAVCAGQGRSSSSSSATSGAAGHGVAEGAAAGIHRYRFKLSD